MVTQNGSLLGLNDGLGKELGTSGLETTDRIIYHYGSPNDLVTSPTQSGVCLDVVNNEFYMSKTIGGSTWFHLISGT